MTTEEVVKARSEFKKSIEKLGKEELKKLLDEITQESKDLDKKISTLEYDLPENEKEVFEKIRYFLNKQTVKSNYVAGMIKIYEFFDSSQRKISFAMLDSVLRILGGVECTGYDEWKKITDIVKYFDFLSESYKEINDKILDLADRYAIVDKQLKLFETVEPYKTEETKEETK